MPSATPRSSAWSPTTRAAARAKPYVPIDVDVLFGEPTVALRGPWGGGDLVKVGPTAPDLARGLYEYHLDFPGDALHPGCSVLEMGTAHHEGRTPVTYAHVVADPDHPGKLALQYWLFFVFNDWNNLHEGDWEMIQLLFDAPPPSRRWSAPRSRSATASTRAQSRRRGMTRSSSSSTARTPSCTRPTARTRTSTARRCISAARQRRASAATTHVVRRWTCGPSSGRSRPILERPGRFRGSGSRGAGASSSRRSSTGRPGRTSRPSGRTRSTGPTAGATAPTPFPPAAVFGSAATGFFCGAIAHGSRSLVRLLTIPVEFTLVLGALVLLLLFLLTRTTGAPPLRSA